MKKILFVVWFLFSIVFVVEGQEFNAGVFGGINATQLDGDTYSGYNKAGIIGGGYINRNFKKKWAWQMGLRYSQKGSRFSDDQTGVYYKSVLHYMEIPVTIRYQHYKKLDFEGGLSFGYLVKALEQFAGTDLRDAKPAFNKIEAAILGGLNYQFSNNLVIGAQYSYSILAVRPYSSGYEQFMDKGQYNNVISFMLTYKLSSWH